MKTQFKTKTVFGLILILGQLAGSAAFAAPEWLKYPNGRIICGEVDYAGHLTQEYGIDACRARQGSKISLNAAGTACAEWTLPDGDLIMIRPISDCK